jgi:hypothetical protein
MMTNIDCSSDLGKTLEVVGYYTTSDSLELRGTSRGLVQLAELLSSQEAACEKLFTVPQVSTADPYDDFLSTVRINKNEGQVVINRNGKILEISGFLEGLKVLSENIKWLATETSDMSNHIHIEYYSGHSFLSPSSGSLVVERDNSLPH